MKKVQVKICMLIGYIQDLSREHCTRIDIQKGVSCMYNKQLRRHVYPMPCSILSYPVPVPPFHIQTFVLIIHDFHES